MKKMYLDKYLKNKQMPKEEIEEANLAKYL